MQILRGSKTKVEWLENMDYKNSVYNITETGQSITAIYNTASGAVAMVENDLINNFSFSVHDIKKLVENGFLVPKYSDEFEKYFSNIRFSPKNSINFFTIIPTTCCNAKCFYCYEEDYCKQSINSQAHISIVNYLVKEIENKEEFVLDWYGGEPLLCAREIDHIITDLSRIVDLSQKRWTSSITTNATLFDEELVKHAINKWNLNAAYITIDGTEEDHNFRKNVFLGGKSAFAETYKAITFLLNAGVYVNLRIHLDNQNKNSFPEIIGSINEFFEFDNFHLFPTFLFPPEFSMEENYIKDFQKEELFYNVFSVLKESSYKQTIVESFPWPKIQNCFATKENTIVISPDGSLHSCVQEFLSDDLNSNDKFCNYSQYCKECKNCKFFPICLGGCIHNRSIKGTVRTPCVRNKFVVHPLLQLLVEDYGKLK